MKDVKTEILKKRIIEAAKHWDKERLLSEFTLFITVEPDEENNRNELIDLYFEDIATEAEYEVLYKMWEEEEAI